MNMPDISLCNRRIYFIFCWNHESSSPIYGDIRVAMVIPIRFLNAIIEEEYPFRVIDFSVCVRKIFQWHLSGRRGIPFVREFRKLS
jgi:hypothetical protein